MFIHVLVADKLVSNVFTLYGFHDMSYRMKVRNTAIKIIKALQEI